MSLFPTNKEIKEQEQIRELGHIIGQGIEDTKVEKEKNAVKMAKRHQTMLEREAERALSGGVQR